MRPLRCFVLGCSGGIGGGAHHTSAYLIDDDMLIDGGTGVCQLPLTELARIDHVFVTHSHLDHVAAIPLLIDSVMPLRSRPIRLHCSRQTWQALHRHIFNDCIWPDFTRLPSAHAPMLVWEPIEPGQTVTLQDRTVTALPARHSVPTQGYAVSRADETIVCVSDTVCDAALISALNALPCLTHLIVESAFADVGATLAEASQHLCPRTLAQLLSRLNRCPDVHVCHLKPSLEPALVMRELRQHGCRNRLFRLMSGDTIGGASALHSVV